MRRSEGIVMRGEITKLSLSCTAFLFLCMLVCVVGVASAKTIYVPDDYEKIQWAVDNASAGDTIVVKGGIYHESDISLDKELSIIGKGCPTINGNGRTLFIVKQHITIESLNIVNASSGIYIVNGPVKVLNCTFKDASTAISTKSSGYIWERGGDIKVVNCKFNNIGTGLDVYFGRNVYVLDSTFTECNDGVMINTLNQYFNYVEISNNSFNCRRYGVAIQGVEVIPLIEVCKNTFGDCGCAIWIKNVNAVVYLNNFINSSNNLYESPVIIYGGRTWLKLWSNPISYVYNGREYQSCMGNYWDDYKGSDKDGNGIGDSPYHRDVQYPAISFTDNYPLVQPWENYFQPVLKPKPKVTVSYEWHDGYINLTIQLRNEGEESNFGGVHMRLENATFVSVDKGTFDSVTAYDIIDPEAVDRDPANHTMEIEEKPNVVELYVKGDSAHATARIKPGAGDGLKIYYRAWLKDKDDTVYNPYTGKYEAYIARDPVEEPDDPHSRNPPYSRHVGDERFSFIDYKCHDIRVSNVKILPVPYEYQDGAQWCALASAAMLLRYYGYDVHLWDIARDLNLPKENGTNLSTLNSYLKEKYNLKTDLTRIWFPSKKSVIKRLINEGEPVILSISNESESKSGYEERKFGHAVVVIGYMEAEDDFYIYVNDPSGALFEELGIDFREPVISYPLSLKFLEDKAEKYDWKIGGLNIEEREPVVRGGSINVYYWRLLEWEYRRDGHRSENLVLGDGGLVWDGFIWSLWSRYNYSSQTSIPYSEIIAAVNLKFGTSNHYPFKREYDLLLALDDLGNIIGSWNITVNAESWNCPERDISSYLDHIPPGNHTLYFLVYDDDGNMCDEISVNITVVAPNLRVNVSDCRLISPHEIEFKLKLENEGHAGDFSGIHVRVENGTFISADKGDFESVTAYDESGRPINVEGSRILEFYNKSMDGGAELETGWIRVRAEKGIVKLLFRGWIKDDSAKIYNPYSKKFESYIARDPAEYETDNPPYSRHAFDEEFSFLDYECYEFNLAVFVPDGYPKIQQAVETSNIVIVRDGVYRENIIVNKSLTILSENGSTNCVVQAADSDGDVFHVTADNVNISGFTIEGGYHGIYIDHAENCYIANNSVSDNKYGIHLRYSSNNTISGNTILNNNEYGICLDNSDNNIITDNLFICNVEGIRIGDSCNNVITDNTFENDGIFIHYEAARNHNYIRSNTINGKPLIYLENVSDRVITKAGQVILVGCNRVTIKNLDISNACVGLQLYGVKDSRIMNVNIANCREGIILKKCSNVEIKNTSLFNCSSYASSIIYLFSTNSTTIANSTITDGSPGIVLVHSFNNTIAYNTLTNVWASIKLVESSNNSIIDNTITNKYIQPDAGISVYNSNHNRIIKNKVENFEIGIDISHSDENVIVGNDVKDVGGVEINLCESKKNIISSNTLMDGSIGVGIYGIYPWDKCDENTIVNNTISNCNVGVVISRSCKNTIESNNVSNNIDSVKIIGSCCNLIRSNTISNNSNSGIWLLAHSAVPCNCNFITMNTIYLNKIGILIYSDCHDNVVYLNNFLRNEFNAVASSASFWNSTEKITYIYSGKTYRNYMGNYWDDYKVNDINGDGIGDKPYVINKDNIDDYPLIMPFENYFTSIHKVVYVPDNYSKIQLAVDYSPPGSTIIVRNGTYAENIVVTKSLTIRSENGSNRTIIKSMNDFVVKVAADNVVLEGFTITGGEFSGVMITSNNTVIKFNDIISNGYHGIYVSESCNVVIASNNISLNDNGITISNSRNVTVTSNIISFNNYYGISIFESDENTIVSNTISSNNEGGIELFASENNNITLNTISSSNYGFVISKSNDNHIFLNNFIDNEEYYYSESTNIWNSTSPMTYTYNGRTYTGYMGNYWSDYTGSDADGDGIGDTPYAINGDVDNYPLMQPQENYFLPAPSPTPTPTPTPIPAQIFDTGRPENPYPSISGKFVGTIRTNKKVIAKKLYTYACEGTGGHTEYAIICNKTWCAEAKWEGYKGDWMNISFNRTVVLMPYETYNITIVTGSYPQIHHTSSLKTENGWINCTEFIDANGKKYENWIPAIKLW